MLTFPLAPTLASTMFGTVWPGIMLTLDANGRVNARFDTPPDLPRPVAMAVTLEPEGGVPAPTGDKYLVGLAN